eukprot:CAMPEP_0178754436 /NCGR_PEP_ID=MMETSP0744-20121128/12156_1 /TAXON_ID=913974 /ORGANISM="Nitzschia punctata, Strain CCMP561" /LENGTH=613 /DNA_ID=CAMNT_0020408343 /DNA_START=6 /DNA_END=1847 /DNA_ORIENTATION=-
MKLTLYSLFSLGFLAITAASDFEDARRILEGHKKGVDGFKAIHRGDQLSEAFQLPQGIQLNSHSSNNLRGGKGNPLAGTKFVGADGVGLTKPHAQSTPMDASSLGSVEGQHVIAANVRGASFVNSKPSSPTNRYAARKLERAFEFKRYQVEVLDSSVECGGAQPPTTVRVSCTTSDLQLVLEDAEVSCTRVSPGVLECGGKGGFIVDCVSTNSLFDPLTGLLLTARVETPSVPFSCSGVDTIGQGVVIATVCPDDTFNFDSLVCDPITSYLTLEGGEPMCMNSCNGASCTGSDLPGFTATVNSFGSCSWQPEDFKPLSPSPPSSAQSTLPPSTAPIANLPTEGPSTADPSTCLGTEFVLETDDDANKLRFVVFDKADRGADGTLSSYVWFYDYGDLQDFYSYQTTESVCLNTDSCYVAALLDSGNGGFDTGSLTLTANGESVLSIIPGDTGVGCADCTGGDAARVWVAEFGNCQEPSSTTSAATTTTSCNEGEKAFEMLFITDFSPEDYTMALIEYDNGQFDTEPFFVLAEDEFEANLEYYTSEPICLDTAHKCYAFILNDAGLDGLQDNGGLLLTLDNSPILTILPGDTTHTISEDGSFIFWGIKFGNGCWA